MLRVMLVDDEPPALQRLSRMLEGIGDVEIVAAVDSAEAGVAVLAREQVDLLFLDVQMPDKDGFELLASLPRRPMVVFVTAFSGYAAQAFEVEAVDYLLKPVRPARLEVALRRARTALRGGSEPVYDLNDRICLRTPERTVVAPLGDMITLEADRDFSRVTVLDNAPLLICKSLGTYDATLPNPPFFRISRSLIVNLSRLRSVELSPIRGARIVLDGIADPISIGRTALKRLRTAIPHDLTVNPER